MKQINFRQVGPNVKTLVVMLLVLLIASPVWAEEPAEVSLSAFEELPKETREVLKPFERHWDRIIPAKQKRLLNKAQSPDPEERRKFKKHAEHFKNLGPQDRKRLHEAKRLFDKMPPHERKNLRHHFDTMDPQESGVSAIHSEPCVLRQKNGPRFVARS